GSNARIHTHAKSDFRHVGTYVLAQIGDHVDERNLHRKERVGSMLDQLGRVGVSHHPRRLLAVRTLRMYRTSTALLENWPVNLFHLPCGFFGFDADDNAIRMEEVFDR